VYVRSVDPSDLLFSLSAHRHSYIGLLFSSRFIDSSLNKQTFIQKTTFVNKNEDHVSNKNQGGLEHLKIKTMLIDERFTSVMGECVI
jgi:hypothetical protein